MSTQFQILTVDEEAYRENEKEQIGSKLKFWFYNREDNSDWLFKYARPETGEHWAEKIAAELARQLTIPHATVELSVVGTSKGSASQSFIHRGINADLVHGNEILSGRVLGYDQNKKYSQKEHTFANIIKAIQEIGTPEEVKTALHRMAGYIVLDALIGNTDRHHENWAFIRYIRYIKGNRLEYALAPTFDHASSLGRELQDERRRLYLEADTVATYSSRGRGAIYITGQEKKGANPTDLAIFACQHYPQYFISWLSQLGSFDISIVRTILNQVPDEWMSETARDFAYAMVEFNYTKLLRIRI